METGHQANVGLAPSEWHKYTNAYLNMSLQSLRQGVGEITFERKGKNDVGVSHNRMITLIVAKVSKIEITGK